jgi:bifunctional non-homologous end joining protein LigD
MPPLKICLPTRAAAPPAGPDWLHEIKHDGFRMLAVREGDRARLISRRGLDWGSRFPPIIAAVEALVARTCTIDGELIACDGDGLADFELLRRRRRDAAVTLVAFDLIELDGRDLRREPIETREFIATVGGAAAWPLDGAPSSIPATGLTLSAKASLFI